MGLRFQRSLRLGRPARLNVEGSGSAFGRGPRNSDENVVPASIRKTADTPDHGLSRQSFSRWPPDSSTSRSPQSQDSPPATSPVANEARPGRVLPYVVLMAALVVGAYLFGRLTDTTPAPDVSFDETPAAVALTPPPSAPPEPAPLAPASPAIVPAEASAGAIAPEVAKPNPVNTPTMAARPLSSGEMRELQAWLGALGFGPGPLDGLPGPQTTAAVKRYQAAREQDQTGLVDRSLLQQVRKEVGH